jgi:recombination protein RecT
MVKKQNNDKGNGTTTLTRKEKLESFLNDEKFTKSLQDVIPKHLTPERIVKMALVAASRQPKLFDCTPQSFLQSVMKSAELGLDCVGTLGQGYLVPYYNSKIKALECQFIAGYQGLINLARRSGHISRIESRVVYENDIFDVEYGLDQKLTHRPYLGGERGKIVCVYAVAELKDGSSQLEIMTIDEVEAIRERSKAKDSGPWKTDFGEMARKTVVRRIAKYLPLSPELAKAIETDDQQFDFGVHGETTANVQAGINGLKNRLKEQEKKKIESTEVPPEEPADPEFEAKKKKDIKGLKEANKKATAKKKEQPKDEPVTAKFECTRCEQKFAEMPSESTCPTCIGEVAEIVAIKD